MAGSGQQLRDHSGCHNTNASPTLLERAHQVASCLNSVCDGVCTAQAFMRVAGSIGSHSVTAAFETHTRLQCNVWGKLYKPGAMGHMATPCSSWVQNNALDEANEAD